MSGQDPIEFDTVRPLRRTAADVQCMQRGGELHGLRGRNSQVHVRFVRCGGVFTVRRNEDVRGVRWRETEVASVMRRVWCAGRALELQRVCTAATANTLRVGAPLSQGNYS